MRRRLGGSAALLALLALLAAPARAAEAPPRDADADAEAEGAAEAGPSKKQRALLEKAARAQGRRTRALAAPRPQAEAVLSVRNLWTHEVLPLREGAPLPGSVWDRFLRCHHTNQSTQMDPRLLGVMRGAAAFFQSRYAEVVSGFRAPKYNLMLRKKGHQVARDSQHTHGNALDFRLAGVNLRELRRFVWRRGLGGVGYYPRSQFIHADTGPRRTWVAE